LQAEIAGLKADSNLAEKAQQLKEDKYHYKIAEIYSRYPFNDQSMVVINLGSADGIKEGMPVFLERGVLFGKVRTVRRTQSDVETIFNTSWKTSVSIGTGNVKAVYVGGPIPTLDFIPKDAKIAAGDSILNIAPDLPLHVSLGTVLSMDPSSYDVWQRAKISPDFDLNTFNTVLVMIDFP
jgi:rod shape-determining protein MreC